MIKFGPSGNSQKFFDEGHKHSNEAPLWLKEMGLELYEYSFGRGVNLNAETAEIIGNEAVKHGIEVSAHSPYYINFASDIDETIIKSVGYMIESLDMLRRFKGTRCVVHPGSPLKQDRKSAAERLIKNFTMLAAILEEKGYSDLWVCPETMGKLNQMGTLAEVLDICRISPIYVPCIDFGHLNSRNGGDLKGPDDYRRIMDGIFTALGEDKGRRIHVHFSRIEYGASGEIRHLTFSDDKFGPYFEHLAPVLLEYKVECRIISESNGTQAEDAAAMRKMYYSLMKEAQ